MEFVVEWRRCSALLIIASLLPLAACSKAPIGEAPSVVEANLDTIPPPTAADYTHSPIDEVARPYDKLKVEVFGVQDLSRTVAVGQGGYFDYPLIGAVQANGRTLTEIGFEIETRLANSYVREPDITVEFESRVGQLITVGGEVGAPGQHEILRPTTLMEAIAIAGGIDQYATKDEVLVFRDVDDVRYIGVYDFKAIERGNYPDPRVYANDVIMVGESPSRRLIDNILRYTQLILSPVILVERISR